MWRDESPLVAPLSWGTSLIHEDTTHSTYRPVDSNYGGGGGVEGERDLTTSRERARGKGTHYLQSPIPILEYQHRLES